MIFSCDSLLLVKWVIGGVAEERQASRKNHHKLPLTTENEFFEPLGKNFFNYFSHPSSGSWDPRPFHSWAAMLIG
jgi:hypothetical protein